MRYVRMYFVRGAPRPKDRSRMMDYAIKEPPVAGNACAFILGKDKRVTVFHPFTLMAFSVPKDCTEVNASSDIPLNKQRLIDIITHRWMLYKDLDMQRSYDIAAQVLVQLGGPIPEYRPSTHWRRDPKEEKKSGKPLEADRFKIVKEKSRRGQVAQFYMNGPTSIFEGMAKLSLTRSALLSQLFMLWKDHGLGYTVMNDSAELHIGEQMIFGTPLDIEDNEEDIFA